MKKTGLILLLALTSLVLNAQTQVLKSNTYYQGDINYIKKTFDRTITIDAKNITITKFIDANSKDLKLTVSKIEDKEWSGLPCKWYYCSSLESKPQKVIVIVLPDADEVDVFMYLQEVYPFIYKLDINKK
jgi:hypothetical protein